MPQGSMMPTKLFQVDLGASPGGHNGKIPLFAFMSNGAWEQGVAIYGYDFRDEKWRLLDTRAESGHKKWGDPGGFSPSPQLLRVWLLHKTVAFGAGVPWLNSTALSPARVGSLDRLGSPNYRSNTVRMSADDGGGGSPSDRNVDFYISSNGTIDVTTVNNPWPAYCADPALPA